MSTRRAAAIDRASFRHWTTVSIRYNDQDPLGHVNNAAFATYLEQARCMFVYPLMRAHGGGDLDLVLARLELDYLSELAFPGNVEIGSRLARLGTKSLTLEHAIYAEGAGQPAASARCVIVFFDTRARASVVPPAEIAAALARLRAP
jgi:acyl-CoA thioester hydrolase